MAAFLLLVPPAHHAQDAVPGAQWQLVPVAKSGWSESGLAEARKWPRFSDVTKLLQLMLKADGLAP
ncbi:MAG TPA: hypothetical protein VMI56_12500 [Reyranella sp.]|nr:hypothetical protein [Reyranella sp.]